uniref:Ig-like domain repeat protein n=2 Tax=Methanosphaera sp. TaxID=2666342 RepID=UPI0025D53109
FINGQKYYAKTDNTGKYILSVKTNKVGTNNVTIGYSGNDKYNPYETNTTFTVTGKQPVTVTYEPINDVNFGENVTITGKFMTNNGKAISNSNVKIYINGIKYLAKTDNTGKYTLSVQTTQTGTNKVSVGYSGNDKYEAYETNTTFTVTGKQPVTVTYEPINNVKQGQNVTITGKFTTNTGKAITNTNVKILINGKKYYAKTDNTGKYTLSTQANTLGTNNVTIGYSGNDKYEAYETNTTFTVLKA